ncbi:unnamed protein product [Closterium sp. Yama58-4]|nr:unnamed protein product [Closterium sp. Yama58-4]
MSLDHLAPPVAPLLIRLLIFVLTCAVRGAAAAPVILDAGQRYALEKIFSASPAMVVEEDYSCTPGESSLIVCNARGAVSQLSLYSMTELPSEILRLSRLESLVLTSPSLLYSSLLSTPSLLYSLPSLLPPFSTPSLLYSLPSLLPPFSTPSLLYSLPSLLPPFSTPSLLYSLPSLSLPSLLPPFSSPSLLFSLPSLLSFPSLLLPFSSPLLPFSSLFSSPFLLFSLPSLFAAV